MKGKFIKNPNLPENDASVVIAANGDKSLLNALSQKSIKVLTTVQKPDLDVPVSNHGDILVHHICNSTFIVDESQKAIINYLTKRNCNLEIINSVCSPYPADCLLNCADIGDYLICKPAITHPAILSKGKTIIYVRQGYAKCSVCVIGRNKIITDDISIYNAVKPFEDIKVLLIETGSIKIKKYDYGFIGGCSGLIGKNKLFFNGDLSTHKNYKDICNFLNEHNVAYFDIKNKPLTDVGSIIPIIEG